MTPKILIACPTSELKDYCFNEWVENKKRLTFKDIDFYIIDNSINNPNYVNKIREAGFNADHHSPNKKDTSREFIRDSFNKIRDYFLKDKTYTHLLIVESDIMVIDNICEYLLRRDKDVIGIPYFTKTGENTYFLNQTQENIGYYRRDQLCNNFKSFFEFNGKLKEGYQFGIGCILIKRHVIEKIKFRIEINNLVKPHNDSFFHQHLFFHGIKTYLDNRYICVHQNQDWDKVMKKNNINI